MSMPLAELTVTSFEVNRAHSLPLAFEVQSGIENRARFSGKDI
jgi:hypothetical protein